MPKQRPSNMTRPAPAATRLPRFERPPRPRGEDDPTSDCYAQVLAMNVSESVRVIRLQIQDGPWTWAVQLSGGRGWRSKAFYGNREALRASALLGRDPALVIVLAGLPERCPQV